jgi:hypothetical protein
MKKKRVDMEAGLPVFITRQVISPPSMTEITPPMIQNLKKPRRKNLELE